MNFQTSEQIAKNVEGFSQDHILTRYGLDPKLTKIHIVKYSDSIVVEGLVTITTKATFDVCIYADDDVRIYFKSEKPEGYTTAGDFYDYRHKVNDVYGVMQELAREMSDLVFSDHSYKLY